MPILNLGRVVGADGKDGAPGAPGADGKTAYQYAKDGGYTGTEEEFKALQANAASKNYVDEKISQIAPIILRVELDPGPGYTEFNVKCYPLITENSTYSVHFIIPYRNANGLSMTIYPPAGYSFTGLYGSSGLQLIGVDGETRFNRWPIVKEDGSIITYYMSGTDVSLYHVTGVVTLEVK